MAKRVENSTVLEEEEGSQYECLSLPDFLSSGDVHSWKELQDIEHRRREILKRVDNPFWRILGYWDGTCLKVMVKDGLMWATLGIFLTVRLCFHAGHLPVYLMDLDESNIDIIGGFLSFFLVLFVNQSNARFQSMFHKSMQCTARIEDVAAVVAAYFPKPNAHRLIRYLNAAHAAVYVGLASDTYTTHNFFTQLNDQYKFLTHVEMDRVVTEIGLERSGGACFRELLMWCVREVQIMQQEQVIDARMSGELRGNIQHFRATASALYHDKDQPIHFFYLHFLVLLTAFYLPLFAITTALGVASDQDGNIHWIPELLSALIVFLQAVFVIGLRLLGQVMLDPYGDDLEDLSVLHYVQDTWTVSNRLLATRWPAPVDAALEEDLIQTRASVGVAWESSSSSSSSSTGKFQTPSTVAFAT